MSRGPSSRRLQNVSTPHSVEAAGTTYRAGGGNIVPPPPISLQEPGRFLVFLEDVSEVSERRQLPPSERISPRSRAPSISSRSRYVRVRLPPPPPLDSPWIEWLARGRPPPFIESSGALSERSESKGSPYPTRDAHLARASKTMASSQSAVRLHSPLRGKFPLRRTHERSHRPALEAHPWCGKCLHGAATARGVGVLGALRNRRRGPQTRTATEALETGQKGCAYRR